MQLNFPLSASMYKRLPISTGDGLFGLGAPTGLFSAALGGFSHGVCPLIFHTIFSCGKSSVEPPPAIGFTAHICGLVNPVLMYSNPFPYTGIATHENPGCLSRHSSLPLFGSYA